MSLDPGIIVTMIQTCVTIYGYLKDVKEYSSERSRFMREVLAFKGVLTELQEQLHDPEVTRNPSLMAHLARLFDPSGPFVPLMKNTLRDLEEKLKKGGEEHKTGLGAMANKVTAAVFWTMDKGEVETLLADVERYKSLISLALEQDASHLEREMHKMALDMNGKLSSVAETVTDIKASVDTLGATISADECRKVAEWISEVSFSALHAAKSREWLPGTGTWVLESSEFQSWASRTALSPTLWCYGNAGAGKSVIAAMVVEHLQKNTNNVVLVIVCRYNQNRKYFGETYTFLCCLLRQLLRLDSDASSIIPQTLLDLYRKDRHPSEDCIRTLLIETARIISRPIFIVLDALDECPLGFALVAAIQGLGNTFNLLITSRDVFAEIKDYPSLYIRATNDDILAVINDKIPALPYVRDDEDLQAAVRTEIITKAKGMFLLANLKLWELEHDVTSKADVREMLASIPASLDDTYHQIFNRIRAQGDRRKELALQAVMWLYTQFDWFHMELDNSLDHSVLRFLLTCKISSPEPEFQNDHMPSVLNIINACGGLLAISPSETDIDNGYYTHRLSSKSSNGQASALFDLILPASNISFIHYSVHEYISRFRDSILPKDHCEFAFSICTIALCHKARAWNVPVYLKFWLHFARILDHQQPAVIWSALANTNFNECVTGLLTSTPGRESFTHILRRPKWLKRLRNKEDLNALDYAAIFGLPGAFQHARQTMPVDKDHFQQAMEILVGCRHWKLVHELWKHGEYDINAYCKNIGSTALCKLLTTSSPLKFCAAAHRRSFLQHPGTSLCCPRHGDLLVCAMHCQLYGRPTWGVTDTAIILERLARDMNDEPSQRGRISVYLPPSRTRSRPPDILDIIAVFLQREDIDLDAQITQMVPPEILLALLMFPWYQMQYIWNTDWFKELRTLVQPYARRSDIQNIRTLDHVPDADQLVVLVPATTAQPAGITDTAARRGTPEIVDHMPSAEVLGDRVISDTALTRRGRNTRRVMAVLLLGTMISSFLYLWGLSALRVVL